MRISKTNSERYFFTGISIWFLSITFLGFSSTFYLRQLPESLPFHLKLHGSLFTCWILFFLVQTSLISLKKVQIHKTMGFFGLILILAMIPAGFYPVLYKVSIGTKTIDHGGYNLATLTLAYVFFFLGLMLRGKPFYHKRFMFFATLVFTIAATDRVALVFELDRSQLFRKSLVFFPAIALFTFDYIRLRNLYWFDLLPVVMVLFLFFFSDFFWLSSVGESLMKFLVNLI